MKTYRHVTSALIVLLPMVLFWPTLYFGPVQDNYGVIYNLMFHTTGESLFFRPLGMLLYYVIVSFGIPAFVWHSFGLALHIATSFIVVGIVKKLFEWERVAYMVGLFYSCSLALLDPLSWMVGFYDLGCVFFFVLAFYLFLRGSYWSILAYALALLFKESAMAFPFVASAYYVSVHGKNKLVLGAFWLVALLYLAVRFFLVSGASSNYDYALGINVVNNLVAYASWSAYSALLFGVICIGFIVQRGWKKFADMGVWWLLSLLPVLFLADYVGTRPSGEVFHKTHAIIYYMVYSLPAFYCLVCGIATKPKHMIAVAAVFAVVFLISYSQLRSMVNGDTGYEYVDGFNNLPRKVREAEAAKALVLGTYPKLSPHTTVMLPRGINPGTFAGDYGLRVWYNDSTLHVTVKK